MLKLLLIRSLRLLTVSLLSILITANASFACSVSEVPLRKVFRHADAVFRGKVVQIVRRELSPREKQLVPEVWRDWNQFSLVTLDIENSWKGGLKGTKEFVAVDSYDCGCPNHLEMNLGDELIVFSGNIFLTVCQTVKTHPVNTRHTRQDVHRIDSFWFRTWARIYPF